MSHTFKVNLLTLQICYIQTVSNIPLPISVVFQDIGTKCKTNRKVHFILRIKRFIDTLKKKQTKTRLTGGPWTLMITWMLKELLQQVSTIILYKRASCKN